jgi:hypothetical protein
MYPPKASLETRKVNSNLKTAHVSVVILDGEIIAIEVMFDETTFYGVRNDSLWSCTNLEHFGCAPYSFTLEIGKHEYDAVEKVTIHSLDYPGETIDVMFRWHTGEFAQGFNTQIALGE